MEVAQTERQPLVDELNQLTERRWDLLAEIREIDVARTALFNQLRGKEDGNIQ